MVKFAHLCFPTTQAIRFIVFEQHKVVGIIPAMPVTASAQHLRARLWDLLAAGQGSEEALEQTDYLSFLVSAFAGLVCDWQRYSYLVQPAPCSG